MDLQGFRAMKAPGCWACTHRPPPRLGVKETTYHPSRRAACRGEGSGRVQGRPKLGACVSVKEGLAFPGSPLFLRP